MRKIFLTLMAALLSTTVWAGTLFTMGNFIYEVQSEPSSTDYGTCSVYGLSNEGKSATALVLPSTAWNSGKGYYVRSINASAFKDQKNFTAFTAHHQLSTINAYAFQGCTGLQRVYLPSSMWRIYAYAFDGCTKLSQVYLASPTPMTGGWFSTSFPANSNMNLYIGLGDPNGIYKYKNSTQGTDCSRFASVQKSAYACDTWYNDGTCVRVTKAATKSTVGEFAMVGFYSGASGVSSNAWVPKPANSSYDYSCNDLNYNLTSIIDSVCVNNTTITRVDLDYLPNVNTIGSYAFKGCTSMTYAYLNAKTVGSYSFSGCTALKGAYPRTKTITVNSYAFRGCTALTSMNVNKVTSWDPRAIAYCTGITAYSVDASNTAYSVSNGILFNKAQTKLVSYPPAKDTYSQDYIPTTVTSFGAYAFYTNNKITTIAIPYGVKSIGFDCFWNMTELTYIRIPGSVTSIENYAFEGCTKLDEIDCNMPTPVTIANHFSGAKNPIRTLRVPYDKIDTYKNAGWTVFTNYNSNYWQAYDHFTSDYCYSVMSNTSTTVNGITYAGTARLVSGSLSTQQNGAKNIPASVTIRGKSYAVTSIGADAFRGNTNSFSIAGATNVDTVYNDAFNGSNLTSITLPVCRHLRYRAFKNATKLTSVNFPKLNNIYDWSFQGCTGLTSATLPSIVTIWDYAFDGCTKLSTMTFGPNLYSIHQYAFQNCSALTHDIKLPYGFAGLYSYAFSGSGVKRIKVPSTVTTLQSNAFAGMKSLTDLYLNKPLSALTPPYTFGNTPTTAALRVPAGQVNQYKNDSNWGRFTTITPGGYDYSLSSGINSNYHMTVLTTASVTKDGVTCDGTAMYVYNPVLSGSSETSYSPGVYETNSEYPELDGYTRKKYFITEIGDSAFVNTKIASFTVPKYVTKIGNYAFYGNSGLTTFNIPENVSTLGRYAFVKCTALTDLTWLRTSGVSWLGQFYGGNASNFKCYVCWDLLPYYKASVGGAWSTISPSTAKPIDQLNGWFKNSSTSPMAFSVMHPVDFNASGLNEAYVVYNYDSAKKQVNTQQVTRVPENTGVILTGFTADKMYKLQRPTVTVSAPNNLLIGTSATDVNRNVYNENVGYYFNRSQKRFDRPTGSYTVGYGTAYLKLGATLAGSTTQVAVDLWPQTLVGDVNGNGAIDLGDLTMLVDLVSKGSSNERSDVNNDNETSIGDITKLVEIIMQAGL